jgi:predicted RNase H-like HicB family nuclease
MAEYRMKEAIKIHLEGLKEGEIAMPSTKAVSIEVTA